MESNFWFYTLSAMPQTLGAIIALTATFIVITLDKINDKIDSHCYHIKIILRAINEKTSIPKSENPKDFLDLFGKKIMSDDNIWLSKNYQQLFKAYNIIVHDPSLNVPQEELGHWLNEEMRNDLI